MKKRRVNASAEYNTRSVFVFLYIFIIISGIFSQDLLGKTNNTTFETTELENLWNKCRKYSIEIQTSENSLLSSEVTLAYSDVKYVPSFSLLSSASFSDTYEESIWDPGHLSAGIRYSETLPGSLSVSLTAVYGLSKDIASVLDDDEGITYRHSPSLSLSLTQGLNPYWLQGYHIDPYKALLIYSLAQSIHAKNMVIKNALLIITGYYIQIRQMIRNVDSIEKTISIYDEIIDSLYKLKDQGGIDYSEIWEKEDERLDYMENLMTYKANIDNILMQLKRYCGKIESFSFLGILPGPETLLLEYDPEESILETKMASSQAQFIQQKQSQAAQISLSGSISCNTEEMAIADFFDAWDTEKTFSWSFSITLDLSPFFSPQNKLTKKTHALDIEKYSLEIMALQIEKENSRHYYEKMFADTSEQNKKLIEVYRKRQMIYRDMQELLEKGGCSRIDVLQAEVQCNLKKCKIENQNDTLWYYSWLISNL